MIFGFNENNPTQKYVFSDKMFYITFKLVKEKFNRNILDFMVAQKNTVG